MIDGPATGAAANFMHLLRESDPEARHLAFCDQDDVWLPHKIERALAMLAEQPEEIPVLYCSRTLVCNATLQEQCASRMPRRTPSFRNALVQNIVAGNTIVLNETASRLAREEAGRGQTVAVHDWWLYQLITAVGGTVIYDKTPGLLYRQHGANEIGVHTGFHASLWRVAQVLSGRYRRWNELNVAALAQSAAAFTPENRARFEAFAAGRGGSLPRRVIMLGRTGVHRQSRVGNAALWLSALLGRL